VNAGLSTYVGRQFFLRCLAAMLALTALFQILDLLDATTDVLERGLGVGGILTYTMLRLPVILEQTPPLGVLIGALMTFAALAHHNEIVAMRSAGLSVARIVMFVAPWVACLMLLHLLLADQLVPRAERRFATWWGSSALEPAEPKPTWLRVDGFIVSIDQVAEGGSRLTGVRIYRRNAQDQLQERLFAPAARHDAEGWLLQDAVEITIDGDRIVQTPPADRRWPVSLRPPDIIAIMNPFSHLSAGAARGVLEGERASARPPAFYETRLLRVFAEPVACLVMLLLATPAATANRRGGDAGKRLLLVIAGGLLFLLVDGILVAMGEAGRLPPIVAAWGAVGAFGSIGLGLLAYLDG